MGDVPNNVNALLDDDEYFDERGVAWRKNAKYRASGGGSGGGGGGRASPSKATKSSSKQKVPPSGGSEGFYDSMRSTRDEIRRIARTLGALEKQTKRYPDALGKLHKTLDSAEKGNASLRPDYKADVHDRPARIPRVEDPAAASSHSAGVQGDGNVAVAQ
jgi:hypothetical protein